VPVPSALAPVQPIRKGEPRVTKRETADPSPADADPFGKRRDRLLAIAPTLIGAVIQDRPPPAPPKPAPEPPRTAKERKRQGRRQRAAAAAQREREAVLAAAEAQEAREEEIAPSAQRRAVTAPDGSVVRAARLTLDGVTFRVSNPIDHLVARGGSRSESGLIPEITRSHATAADRLRRAWEDGGRGVGTASGVYNERSGGAIQSGWIADAVLSSIDYQTRMRVEFEGAITWMGGFWPCIDAIVLKGMGVSFWAVQQGRDRKAVVGYLGGALDRLAEFYAAVDRAKASGRSRTPIRSVAIENPLVTNP